MTWRRSSSEENGGAALPATDEQADVDWTAWLRARLEEGPPLGANEVDDAVTDEVSSLREAVDALARERDREVLAGLHALRTVVDSVVEAVADFPSAVRQMPDARAGELEDRILALRQDMTASLQELVECTRAMVAWQEALDGRLDAVIRRLDRLSTDAEEAQQPSAVPFDELQLDEAQLDDIAVVVAEMMREDPAPTAPDTTGRPDVTEEPPTEG